MRGTTNSNYSMGHHKITILLIDDQIEIAEAVQQALSSEDDIEFHYCQDPTEAIKKGEEAKKISAPIPGNLKSNQLSRPR